MDGKVVNDIQEKLNDAKSTVQFIRGMVYSWDGTSPRVDILDSIDGLYYRLRTIQEMVEFLAGRDG